MNGKGLKEQIMRIRSIRLLIWQMEGKTSSFSGFFSSEASVQLSADAPSEKRRYRS